MENNENGFQSITDADLENARTIIKKIMSYYNSKVVNQPKIGISLLAAMISNGHVLMESVPGLAKTTAARVMTEAVNGSFSRVQCTPDLLPSDIIGTQIFNMTTNSFENKLGPVYANFVLLDEINRSSAKTQSAMLEAMQEREITIGGTRYELPEVFVVMATQNPIEQEGTYVLSEAQQDRFLLKCKIDYPDAMSELEILNRIEADVFDKPQAVASIEEIQYMQQLRKRVYMDDSIKKYIINIVQATRQVNRLLPANLAQYVSMGASTRAAIAFMEAAKASALINGRNYCTPDDVKLFRHEVLGHRITLNYAAIADGIEEEKIVDAIVGAVQTP